MAVSAGMLPVFLRIGAGPEVQVGTVRLDVVDNPTPDAAAGALVKLLRIAAVNIENRSWRAESHVRELDGVDEVGPASA